MKLPQLANVPLIISTALAFDFQEDPLLIQTDHFTVHGTVWPNNSGAHFFGNIPYAEPALETRRFRPPIGKAASSKVIDGYLPGFQLDAGQQQSEDCLTLNIWAPKTARRGDGLPVMIRVHGGGFVTGGAATPYSYGDGLAAKQNVIVVSFNYRLNIFGYPHAAALNGSNLNPGLLDQRTAVEWVRDHIYAFGGDPERMTLFGQSAGGASVDMWSYAYLSDPIVKGLIAQSSVPLDGFYDSAGSDFTYVALQVGCNGSDEDILACMQRADATAIIGVYNNYNASLHSGRVLSFMPAADNMTRFANYTGLQEEGRFARLPAIYSTSNDEGASLIAFNPEGVNQTEAELYTATQMSCPGDRAAAAKAAYGVPVWRTRYYGEWPNLNPFSWLRAYHGSDDPMIFGTSDLFGADAPEQAETSKCYQGAWAAFARDPVDGLVKYGWPRYDPDGRTLVQLGLSGSTTAHFADGDAYQAVCKALGVGLGGWV